MLEVGIVGLPNVGKSTLFNALVKSQLAQAANFAFTTIEPNVGIVEVPDDRINQLAVVENSARTVPAAIKFVDIAGLIAGAHKGEGLGNKFLSHIREVDAIAMVVRTFVDEDVTHVSGKIDPLNDIETILTELALADLDTLEKRLAAVEKEARSGDKGSAKALEVYGEIKKILLEAKPISGMKLTDEQKDLIQEANFLTVKPFIYVFNVSEDEVKITPEKIIDGFSLNGLVEKDQVVVISAKIEGEISALTNAEEQKEFLAELGLKEAGLDRLVQVGYNVLGLQSFFTAGEMEARAWTVKKGAKAPEAAGVIHTDFEKKFVKAEVVPYDDFVALGGWQKAKEKGKVRLEGKEYAVCDGDVMFFHHGK